MVIEHGIVDGPKPSRLENSAVSRVQAKRREVWTFYRDALAGWAAETGTRLPTVPAECDTSYHLFYLLLPDGRSRDAFIAHLKGRGIQAVFHYQPLNASPMGRSLGARAGQCPVAEDASERLVRLPLFFDLTAEHLERIAEAVRSFRP